MTRANVPCRASSCQFKVVAASLTVKSIFPESSSCHEKRALTVSNWPCPLKVRFSFKIPCACPPHVPDKVYLRGMMNICSSGIPSQDRDHPNGKMLSASRGDAEDNLPMI